MPAGADDIELLERRIEEFIHSRMSKTIEQIVASELQRQTAELRERLNEIVLRQGGVDERLYRVEGLRRDLERVNAAVDRLARRTEALARPARSAAWEPEATGSYPSFGGGRIGLSPPTDLLPEDAPGSFSLWFDRSARNIIFIGGLLLLLAILLFGTAFYVKRWRERGDFAPMQSGSTYDASALPEAPAKDPELPPARRPAR